ncbi:S8 family serine peptidase [Paenibacillus lentus]|uniref:SLH domain-containing protein n=1 Tax=Paenibacillus lentus TaxID=1338368 RepID=A0A3S8RZM4_9BACL|nr:S8 family serine peptidase [Paenibacillus lentus]AZK48393.1 hypothetical protein EIM92_21280 [Paenibacillus lentus]
MRKGFWFHKWSIVILAFGLLLGAFPGGGSAAASTVPSLQSFDDLVYQSETTETYISPNIDTSSQSKIRVIVQLDGQPAAVGKYAARVGIRSLAATATESAVRNEQQDFLKEAKEQGLDLHVNYQYNTVLNGFEITIPANEIPSLAQIPGVKSIQENSTWYPIPIASTTLDEAINYDDTPLKQIGADIAWAQGFTGKGLKVGVVDTGVDYEHPDLKDAYKGGYDSFYNDDDPYEEIPLTPADDPYGEGFDGTFHGTHVAGILVGRGANTSGSIAQKGVAYEAELYAYKVLGRSLKNPNSASGTTAQLIDGIERAVKDGMDVINLSLGSDEEKNVNSPDAIAVNNAVLSGVIVVSANGNAGPGYYTMGSPATSQLAIAVGAVTSESRLYQNKLSYQFVDKSTSATDATYTAVPTSATLSTYETTDLIAFGWQTGREDLGAILGSDPIDVVYVGLGGVNDYENKDVAGKVVLASRGKLSFTEKVAYAGMFGAKAIVIFNGIDDGNQANLNESIPDRDGYIDTTLGDNQLFIPAFDMKGKEGRALAKAILKHSDLSLQFAFGANYELKTMRGDILASFSSWGPNADANLSIKPDVMAPGVNILSTYPAYGKKDSNISYEEAYMRSNGTSMSAPYVSGLALLLKQQHPDWTPFDVRAALANTADIIRDENNNRYDVYKQGAGRVNVSNAIKTPALLQALEPITILDTNYSPKNVINYNSSASFGVIAKGGVAVKNLQLKNTSGQAVTYDASVEWHQDHSGVDVSLDKSTITAAAKSAAVLQLDLRVANHAKEGFYQGQVNLTSPGQPTLHLPFTLYVGNQQPENGLGIQEAKLTHSTIYPKRSSQKSTDLSFRLTATDTNYYIVAVLNLKEQLLGYVAAEATDDLNERFAPGVYTVPGINGTYYPVDADGKLIGTTAQLNTGKYNILVLAAQIAPDGSFVKEGEKEITYKASSSLRVDLSRSSQGGGTGGSGSRGGGDGGAAPGGTGGAVPSPEPAKPAPDQAAEAEPSAAAAAVVEQGQKQIIVVPSADNTKSSSALSITDDELKAALSSINNEAAALTIPVPDNDQHHGQVRFTTSQLKQLTEKLNAKSTIVISFEGSAVAVPVSLLNSAPSGAELEFHISQADSDKSKFSANASGATVIGSPVSFEANWIVGSAKKSVEAPSNVFIKRSFTIPGSIGANQAGVLYESNGIIRPIASVMKAQADDSTLVTVSRPGFSVYAAVERSIHFKDIANSWAASDIAALANKFIIQGTSAETFSPNNNLTRAEFTSLLVRSLGLQATGTITFSDVSSNAWYASDVAAAYEAGLIQGTGQDKFSPNAHVTRQELSAILARALKLTGTELKISNPSIQAYKDEASIAGYALENIKMLSAAGIISGDHNDNGQSFRPNAPTTRETAAAALRQFLRQAGFIE